MRKHGVTVNKRNQSLDFVMMKFDFGVDADDSVEGMDKPSMTTQELRDFYYENGAIITWTTFDSKTGNEIVSKRKTIKYKNADEKPWKGIRRALFICEREFI